MLPVMRLILAMIAASSAVAAADPAPEVNLLSAVPSTVAVSSTVDNKTILPAHLVDGKLETAWNSKTGELEGSWIGFRLPASVTVKRIKLTAGFTKVDKKLGDLFTMNPRIKKLAVYRDGSLLREWDLDPESRALQEMAVNRPGGDYKITVTTLVPGTKKSWREVNISELEVWGTLDTGTPAAVKPAVRVGSLDGGVLTRAQCVAAMKAAPTDITEFSTITLGKDLEACLLMHGGTADSADGQIDVAIVKRAARPTLVARLPQVVGFRRDERERGGALDERTVTLAPFPLTSTETALWYQELEHHNNLSSDESKGVQRIYRVSGSSLKNVLELTSSSWAGSTGDSTDCTISQPALDAAMPEISVHCTSTHSAYAGEHSGDKDGTTERDDTYVWKGGVYVKKK
jgi:hypothetical protein